MERGLIHLFFFNFGSPEKKMSDSYHREVKVRVVIRGFIRLF